MTYGWWATPDSTYAELCDECGFDSRTPADEIAVLTGVYDELAALAGHPDGGRRPAEETWSAQEYADHCVVVTRELLRMVAVTTGRPPATPVLDLRTARAAALELLPALTEEERGTVVPEETPQPVTVAWATDHLRHDLVHHVLDMRRGLARLAMADLAVVHAYER